MADRIGMTVDIGTQLLRFGWFYSVNQVVERRTTQLGAQRKYKPTRPVPKRAELFADLRKAVQADAKAVRAGLLPPSELSPNAVGAHVSRVRAMLRDLPTAVQRREAGDAASARELANTADLPDYFTQDFHFQTGGYLTEDSAKLYDVQVETLFYGSAQLMRRAGLQAICEAVRGHDQRKLSLLDVACGTGRLLREIRRALPAIKLIGCDLSDAYLAEAEAH
ncbi:MAG: class I SAM-dependent methyltransferase, partial [Pseudomonadota bacterium]